MEFVEFVAGDGLNIACYSGPQQPQRPKLLFVHGYPDSAGIWQQCAAHLEGSFNVYAYDVRGCGRSEAPKRIAHYEYDYLVQDLVAVIDAISANEPVHVVAHDWGSIQVWDAVTRPELATRFASFTSISGPSLDHAALWIRKCLMQGGRSGRQAVWDQLKKSWYVGAFQLPVLAPTFWKVFGTKAWPLVLQRLGETVEPTNSTQVRDGANGVNLYRANFRSKLLHPEDRFTSVPIQLLVAKNDPFIGTGLYEELPQWCDYFERHDLDAGHWAITKHADRIGNFVAEFVRRVSVGDLSPAAQAVP